MVCVSDARSAKRTLVHTYNISKFQKKEMSQTAMKNYRSQCQH